MFLSQLKREYDFGFIHNPRHFKEGQFWIEVMNAGQPNERKVLMGNSRSKTKRFKQVAILKPKKNK